MFVGDDECLGAHVVLHFGCAADAYASLLLLAWEGEGAFQLVEHDL